MAATYNGFVFPNLAEHASPLPTSAQRLKIVWTLRACARRERHYEAAERRLTENRLATWRAFSGRLQSATTSASLSKTMPRSIRWRFGRSTNA
jgi:hypothetical protein